LTLALCHEGEGKLASAWTEFVDVKGRARQEGRDDREKIASERADALRPRLSTLTVEVPAEVAKTEGLEVRVDGLALGAASFGIAVPVDGGEHRIEASAPGKAPWQAVVSVKPESDAVRAVVPLLGDAAPAAEVQPVGPAPVSEPVAAPPEPASDGSGMRIAALATAGAGVVALGVGGYLALDAKSAYSAAREKCFGLECDQGPYDDVKSAQKQGTIATVVMALGGAVLATGGVLWFLAPSGKEEAPAAAAGVRVERVGLGAQGVLVRGSF
jgi:hypothetical protein